MSKQFHKFRVGDLVWPRRRGAFNVFRFEGGPVDPDYIIGSIVPGDVGVVLDQVLTWPNDLVEHLVVLIGDKQHNVFLEFARRLPEEYISYDVQNR